MVAEDKTRVSNIGLGGQNEGRSPTHFSECENCKEGNELFSEFCP